MTCRRINIILLLYSLIFRFSVYPGEEICTQQKYEAEYPCGPGGFEDFPEASTCLLFVQREATWDLARLSCLRDYQADLVRLDDQVLNAILFDKRKDPNSPYWIGLRDWKKVNTYQWLDDTDETTWYNWDPLLAGDNWAPGKYCVQAGGIKGYWYFHNCLVYARYICQRASDRSPGVPKLTLNYDPGPSLEEMRRPVLANCNAFLTKTANISFEVAGGLPGKDNVLSFGDKKFVMDGHLCRAYLEANLTLPAALGRRGEVITCCWNNRRGFSQCTHSQPLEIKYEPPEPQLVFESSSLTSPELESESVVWARCRAYLGTGGKLVWFLTTEHRNSEWDIYLDQVHGGYFMSQYHGKNGQERDVQIAYHAREQRRWGLGIESFLQINVSTDMNNGKLGCRAESELYNYSSSTLPDIVAFEYLKVGPEKRNLSIFLPLRESKSWFNFAIKTTAVALVLIVLLVAVIMGALFTNGGSDEDVLALDRKSRPTAKGRKKNAVMSFVKRHRSGIWDPAPKMNSFESSSSMTDDVFDPERYDASFSFNPKTGAFTILPPNRKEASSVDIMNDELTFKDLIKENQEPQLHEGGPGPGDESDSVDLVSSGRQSQASRYEQFSSQENDVKQQRVHSLLFSRWRQSAETSPPLPEPARQPQSKAQSSRIEGTVVNRQQPPREYLSTPVFHLKPHASYPASSLEKPTNQKNTFMNSPAGSLAVPSAQTNAGLQPLPNSGQAKVSLAAPSNRTSLSNARPSIRTSVSSAFNWIQTSITSVVPLIRSSLSIAAPTSRTSVSNNLTIIENGVSPAPPTNRTSVLHAPPTIRTSVSPARHSIRTSVSPAKYSIRTSVSHAPSTFRTSVSPAPPTTRTSISPAPPTTRTSISPAPPTTRTSISPAPPSNRLSVSSATPSNRRSISTSAPSVRTNMRPESSFTRANPLPETPFPRTSVLPVVPSVRVNVPPEARSKTTGLSPAAPSNPKAPTSAGSSKQLSVSAMPSSNRRSLSFPAGHSNRQSKLFASPLDPRGVSSAGRQDPRRALTEARERGTPVDGHPSQLRNVVVREPRVPGESSV